MLARDHGAEPLPKVMTTPIRRLQWHVRQAWRTSCFNQIPDLAPCSPRAQQDMYRLFTNRHAETAEQRTQHARYLAERMAPMIRALLLMAVVLYLFATITRTVLGVHPTALGWRLALAVPLVLIALAARRTQRPTPLSLLALACLLLLEVGISLNTLDLTPGQPWVMPGLLLPVASSVIWPGRWDFIAAMTLCALGPLPMLLFGEVDGVHVNQYLVTMAMAITVSVVLRAFMARTLFEQFRPGAATARTSQYRRPHRPAATQPFSRAGAYGARRRIQQAEPGVRAVPGRRPLQADQRRPRSRRRRCGAGGAGHGAACAQCVPPT